MTSWNQYQYCMSSGGSPALACAACCRAANYATSILTNTIYDLLESESAMSNIPDHPYALPISIILTGECVDSCRATNKHQYWRTNPLTIGRLVGINIVCSYRYGFIYHLFNNHCGVGLLGDIDLLTNTLVGLWNTFLFSPIQNLALTHILVDFDRQ